MKSSSLAWPAWLLVAAFLIGCSRSEPESETPTDPVVMVAGDDPEMKSAISTARSKLPEFWKAFENPAQDERNFALKVEIADANGTEHFWVTDLERKEGRIYGTINNDPNTVQSVQFGERIEVPEETISDWTYLRGDKMVGNYTLRPLLKTMPKEEADKFRSMLADP